MIFILEPTEQAKAAIGKRVTVVDHPDGRLSIRYKGVEIVPHLRQDCGRSIQGAIVENKRLGAGLAIIREEQLERARARARATAPA